MPHRVTSGNMVYLAPARRTEETQAADRAGEPAPATAEPENREEPIDLEAVADKVYRLMQRDLTLELERVTRLGG